MRRARIATACAAILTALLLQSALVAPIVLAIPASLPAVLVAAVALVDGPGTGMAFGFVCGLTADLGSDHPAGILALSWLGVGLVAGLVADRRSVRADAIVAAVACGVAAGVATLLLAVVQGGGTTVLLAIRDVPLAALVDAALAVAVVPLTRAFLRSNALHAPQPVFTELRLEQRRG